MIRNAAEYRTGLRTVTFDVASDPEVEGYLVAVQWEDTNEMTYSHDVLLASADVEELANWLRQQIEPF